MGWNAATRSPIRNSHIASASVPRACTIPATSSPLLMDRFCAVICSQSTAKPPSASFHPKGFVNISRCERKAGPLTLLPATITLIRTSSGPGTGMGTSRISVCKVGKGWTMTSFIFEPKSSFVSICFTMIRDASEIRIATSAI